MAAEVGTINNKLISRTRAVAELASRTVIALGLEQMSSGHAANKMLLRRDVHGIQLFGSYDTAAGAVGAYRTNPGLLIANTTLRINPLFEHGGEIRHQDS